MDVLISGAGIAGPNLAYWLARAGHHAVLVEKADALREGGYVIDFWGKGYDIAEQVGILPRLRQEGYFIDEVRMVDKHGRKTGGFPASVFARITGGRFVSLPRSTLSRALFDALPDTVETRFGDSIAAIVQHDDRVDVTFEHGGRRGFDCVVGAEGIHSRTRALVWGAQEQFESYLGYCFAAFTLDGYPVREPDVYVLYSEPGLQAGRFSLRDGATLVLLVWRQDDPHALPHDGEGQRAWLRERLAGSGWEVPCMLDRLEQADDLYLDRVSQIRMGRWGRGRVALLGDAAFAPSFLAGQGSALAMIGGYVLAGELDRAGGDVAKGIAAYDSRLKPFMDRKQDAARRFAGSFVPGSRLAVVLRNLLTRMMSVGWIADLALGRGLRDQIDLPDYFRD